MTTGRERLPSPDDPVTVLHGVGPTLAGRLAESGVTTVGDVLATLPRRYEDRGDVVPVAEATEAGAKVTVQVRMGPLRIHRLRGRRYMSRTTVGDGTGTLPVVWFGSFPRSGLPDEGTEIRLYGRLTLGRDAQPQLVNPEVSGADGPLVRQRCVYPAIQGVSAGRWVRIVTAALAHVEGLGDPLPEDLRRAFGLAGLADSFAAVHGRADRGVDLNSLVRGTTPWQRRLAFDELLVLQAKLADRHDRRARVRGPRCVVDDSLRDTALAMLPFQLTVGQRRAIREIADDLQRPAPMARLLQGDVGSGKTVVAALAMLIAVSSGHQAALLAPTELLAAQHHRSLTGLFAPAGSAPVLITGAQGAGERSETGSRLRDGSASLVVGTHALIQEEVEFHRLGLVVVDEQHRFGTAQREALVRKGVNPHVLVMTATPIPRSLALCLYGDLELSVIGDLPPGRAPVRTEIRGPASRNAIREFLQSEIRAGGRAYVVCPSIDGTEATDIPSAVEQYEALKAQFPEIGVGLVHGRMDRDEREQTASDFRSGEVQILVATTVIEVGVDVPEASIMVIEGAERFGLSTLHQLRGRVGRGERPSWCIAIHGRDVGDEASRRLAVFASCHDGFELAEKDLQQRGPGELDGLRQWGSHGLRFVDLARDADLVERTRDAARRLAAEGRLAPILNALAPWHARS